MTMSQNTRTCRSWSVPDTITASILLIRNGCTVSAATRTNDKSSPRKSQGELPAAKRLPKVQIYRRDALSIRPTIQQRVVLRVYIQ